MKNIRTGYILFVLLSGLLLSANNARAGGTPDPTWVTGAADFEIWLSDSLTWDAGTLVASATLTDNNASTVSATPGVILPDTTYRVQMVLKNDGDGDAKLKDSGDYVRHYNVKGSGNWAGVSPTLGNGAWQDFGANNKDGTTCTTSWDGNNVHITNTSGNDVKIAKDIGDIEGISYLITTDSDTNTSSASYVYALVEGGQNEDSSKITITAAGDVRQNHYRWRADSDGLNSQASGWLAAEDTLYGGATVGTTVRLRIEAANTGSGAVNNLQYRLEYATDTAGSWTAVPEVASASEHFEMDDSSQYSDGDNITASYLTATGTWANGKGIEDPNNMTANYSLTNAYYTEFEYAIKPTSDVTSATYYFRMTDNGATSDFAYMTYPELRILGPYLDQNHYRWRDDLDGLNSQASGWLAAEDTAYSDLADYDPIRLRIELANTGTADANNYQHVLEYSTNVGGPWTTVPVTATTEVFEMVASSQYADGDNITGNYLTATGTWTNGKGIEDPSNKTSNHTLTNAYYTELEYIIQATGSYTAGGTYYFRVTDDGSDPNYTYTRYPTVTMYSSPHMTWETGAADFEIWESSSLTWDAGTLIASATLTNDSAEIVLCDPNGIQPSTQYRVQAVLKNISGNDDIKFKDNTDYIRHYNVKGSGNWAGTSPTLGNGAWKDFGANNKDGYTCTTSWNGNNVHITNTSGKDVKLAKAIDDTEGISYLITTDTDPVTSSTSYWYALEETGLDKTSSLIRIYSFDSDGDLTSAAGVTEPVAISSIADTVGERVAVFDFTISDGGTSDGVALGVSQIVLNTSGTGTFTDLTWQLNGPDASYVTGTVAAGTITFGSLSISVADGASEVYTVYAYFSTSPTSTDNQTFILSVDGDTDLTVDPAGTWMGSTTAVTNGAGSTMNVVHSQIIFSTQPPASANVNVDFAGTIGVSATDVNGNVDEDFSENITISPVLDSDKSPGSGTLSSTDAGGLTKTPSSGVATWTDTKYDTMEVIDIKAVSATTYTTGIYSTAVTVAGDQDGDLTSAAGVTEPVAISSIADTVGERVAVFDFTISDGGTSDSAALGVSQIVLNTSGTGTFSDLTWQLNGPDVSYVTGSVAAGTITFGSLSISVADGTSEVYTVYAYFSTSPTSTDNQTFILSVDGDTDLTIVSGGTQMGTTSPVDNGTGSTMNVVHTQIIFSTQPPASAPVNADFAGTLAVSATDVNGNVDEDFSENITISAVLDSDKSPGSGTLSSTDPGGLTQSPTSGTATWTDTKYDTVEIIDIKAVSATTYTTGIYSSAVEVRNWFIEQTHYRWRNDNGSEAAATWKAAEDEVSTRAKSGNLRLRFVAANTGLTTANNYQYLIEYATSTSGPWTAVPVTASASEHFEMTTTSQYADGDATTAQLTGTGSWAAGKCVEDPNNKTANYSLAAGGYTEFEYNFQATSNATDGEVYYFRMTDDGAALDDYDEYPELVVGVYVDASNSADFLTLGQDRHTFYDGTSYWAFYINDGNDLVYEKSTDGDVWPTPIQVNESAANLTSLGIWQDGTNVYCCYTDGSTSYERQITIATGAMADERIFVASESSPVTLDADNALVTVSGTSWEHAYISSGAWSGDTYRTGIDFDTTSIPDAATITKVELNLYIDDEGGTPPNNDAASMSNTAASYEAVNDYSGLNSDVDGSDYLSNSSGFSGENSYHAVELLPAARTDLENQLSADWFSVGWTGTTETGDNYRDGHDYDEANPPQLIVTYTVDGIASAHDHPQVIKDSGGTLWRKAEEGPTTPTFWVHKATSESDWGSDTQFGSDSSDYGHSMILPLESGNIMALYQDGNTIKFKKFSDPASQGSAANVVTDCATGTSGTWDTAHYFSAVADPVGYVYLTYVDSATGYIEYTLYDQNGGTWSTPNTVSDANSCSNPTLFYDSTSTTLFAFWVSGTSAIKYKRYTRPLAGDWSDPATTLKGSLTDSPAYLTSSYSHGSKIGVMWRGDTSSPPYTAHYETVSFGATIVDLVGLEAIGRFGEVSVHWETDSEIDNAGFNLLRSEHPHYGYSKINSALIAGLGNSAIGAEYGFLDDSVTDGTTYYYMLEDVDFDGKSTLHGPVQAHPGVDSDGDGISNDWENSCAFDPYDPADASLDPDGDGLTNLEEFIQDKDPTISDTSEPSSEGDGDTPAPLEPDPDEGDLPASLLDENVKIRSDSYGITLELVTPDFEIETRQVDDETYQLIKLPFPHGQTTEPGKPQIPVKGVLLGIPFNSSITFDLISYEREVFSGYNLYPVPHVEQDNELARISQRKSRDKKRNVPGLATYRVRKDADTYSADGFYPDYIADIAPVGSLRGRDAAKLNVYPIQFNPATGDLEFYKKIRIKVDFGQAAELDEGDIAESSTPFGRLGERLFHNYQDVRSWRRRSRRYGRPDEGAPEAAFKMSVDEEGIYRLTWQDLLYGAGLNPSWLDPRRIKIYNFGKEIPIYVAGQRDGWFDSEDYIEFYGQAADTRFSSTNIYWLKTAGGRGRRMSIRHSVGREGQTPASFLCETHHEEDRMYWMDIPDTGYVDDHWFFADSLLAPCSVEFLIRLSDVMEVGGDEQSGTIEVALQGISHGFSVPDHHARIYLNGHLVDDTTWDGNAQYIRQLDVPQSQFVEGDNTITIEMPGDTGAEFDWVLANWFKVSYWRQFKAKEDALKFSTEVRDRYSYRVSNFTENDIEVFDITDPARIGRFARPVITAEGGTYTVSFTDHLARNDSKDYLVLSSAAVKSPVSMVADEPSDLRSGQNRADYIIITHEDFYDGILPLAEHRTERGLSVKVVKVQDIYDEFNHGIFSPEAIKSFLKYAYCEWQEPAPTYVLLVGDGTYDYQDNEDLDGKNYVPTYMVHSLDFGETGCDNWFVCLDGDEDILPDMFIGRLPVYTAEQLDTIVNKMISYETSASGDWTKNVTLVADNLEGIFVTISEGLVNYLPQEYQANKIYLDNYPDPADCRTAIIDAVNEGTLMVNYAGHGSAGVWAHEKILRMSDIPLLTNTEKLPFITTMTCGNGYFVFPAGHFDCMAEELLYSPSGGALAILAPTGISYPEVQKWLDRYIFEGIFVDGSTLGVATTQARLSVFEHAGESGVNVIQTFPLFGDPALQLKR